MNIATIFVA